MQQSFQAKWDQFTHLAVTKDTLAEERSGLRRWLLLPYIAFIIPVTDPAAVEQLTTWQTKLSPWLSYDPISTHQLHITLHYVGDLRSRIWPPLPHTWERRSLPGLAQRAATAIGTVEPFTLQVGPPNAFSTVLFAEVHDSTQCLRLLRAKLRRALPLRARPPTAPYLPHVTLGYWGRQEASPLAEAIRPFRTDEPVTIRVTRIKFTVYTRYTAPLNRTVLQHANEEIIQEFVLPNH